jgi:outer membrane protein assembly factor BamA
MTLAAKIQRLSAFAKLFCLWACLPVLTQGQNKYQLTIRVADRDLSFLTKQLEIQTHFVSRPACLTYVNSLPSFLQGKGYVTASVDSVYADSAGASMVLFLGQQYKWASIKTDPGDGEMLAAAGWDELMFSGKFLDFSKWQAMQEKTLRYLENNGYPFGKIYLDSLDLQDERVSARLKIEKGPLYKIDSIRVFGNARISNYFLQQYLGIPNGSLYNREKLAGISMRLQELLYLQEEQPSNMSLLGTGSVLNLYLKQKRSSEVNVLLGFFPNSSQLAREKLLVTGEANIHLRNAFGGGESLGLNWQQLQVKSPRLNIFFRQPYLFKSNMGLDFAFDMFKKDSSFLNINFKLGARYVLSASQAARIYLEKFQTILSQGGIHDALIIATHRLPDVADISTLSIGVGVEKNKTNYRFNPRKGYEFRLEGSGGTKKIKKNNQVLELKDPNDPAFDFETLYDTVKLKSYQVKFSGAAAKYFPIGKQSVFKSGIQGGILHSGQVYRNELFQIGGFKTLRGFDEESEYVSRYAIATLEYRYLVGQNSYFYGFMDGGWAKNTSRAVFPDHTYLGMGLGMNFETKAGIFNLALAVGKRDDRPLNFRQSKIHFGFVNYF